MSCRFACCATACMSNTAPCRKNAHQAGRVLSELVQDLNPFFFAEVTLPDELDLNARFRHRLRNGSANFG
jgi:hypothetical protein